MQVWNLDEAAKFLRISAYTLREKVRAREVPGAKVGGEWRFTDESLEQHMRDLISGRAKKPQPESQPKAPRRRRAPPPLISGVTA